MVNKTKGWDTQMIDQAYHNLIEPISQILDEAQNLGLVSLLSAEDPVTLFLRFIESVEQELFLQWKIKAEGGMEALLSHQALLIRQLLRGEEGLYVQYAGLRQRVMEQKIYLEPCAWRSFISSRAVDSVHFQGLGVLVQEALPYWRFLFRLYQHQPYDLWLGFLNLCELGAGPRLEPLGFTQVEQAYPHLQAVHRQLCTAPSEQTLGDVITQFWGANSGGIFSQFEAFIFRFGQEGSWQLAGEAVSHGCSFDDLFGIEPVKQQLCEAIELFLRGTIHSHVLLWGARGMGKSSVVLALLDRYAIKGLRLVEVLQKDLVALPQLFRLLKGTKERFILFLDDFGFEPGNPEFKALKSAFEGSLEQLPDNVMILATSNKKDVVWTGTLDPSRPESKQAEDEARALGDRFGLKVFFETPMFSQLNQLFEFIALKRGYDTQVDKLWPEFLRFAGHNDHDKPSARTIEQFFSFQQQEE